MPRAKCALPVFARGLYPIASSKVLRCRLAGFCTQCTTGARGGGTIQHSADEIGGVEQAIEVDTGVDAQPVQHVDDILSGDIPGGAWRKRATAETGYRAVEH